MNVGCSSHIYQQCNCIVEGHKICQAKFTLSEAVLAVTNHLLIFHVPYQSFWEDLLHDLNGHRGETAWPSVPQVFRIHDTEILWFCFWLILFHFWIISLHLLLVPCILEFIPFLSSIEFGCNSFQLSVLSVAHCLLQSFQFHLISQILIKYNDKNWNLSLYLGSPTGWHCHQRCKNQLGSPLSWYTMLISYCFRLLLFITIFTFLLLR